jgi:hypothetical protein
LAPRSSTWFSWASTLATGVRADRQKVRI